MKIGSLTKTVHRNWDSGEVRVLVKERFVRMKRLQLRISDYRPGGEATNVDIFWRLEFGKRFGKSRCGKVHVYFNSPTPRKDLRSLFFKLRMELVAVTNPKVLEVHKKIMKGRGR